MNDSSTSTRIKVMLRNNGPIEDIVAFRTMHDRSFVVGGYIDSLDLRIKEHKLTDITDADLRNTETIDELYQLSKVLLADNENLKRTLLGDREHLEWMQHAPMEELFTELESNGRVAQLKQFLNHFKHYQSPMVVIDHKQHIGCLRVVEGKIVPEAPPNWVKAYRVFKDDRLIQYGNKKYNPQVEHEVYKKMYKNQHNQQKKDNYQQREAIKKRREQFAQLQKVESDEEEDSPKVGRFE